MSDQPPSLWRALFWAAIWIAFIAAMLFAFHLAHAASLETIQWPQW